MNICLNCPTEITGKHQYCAPCRIQRIAEQRREGASRRRKLNKEKEPKIMTRALNSDHLLLLAENVTAVARADEDPGKAVRLGRLAACRFLNRELRTDVFKPDIGENEIKALVRQVGGER